MEVQILKRFRENDDPTFGLVDGKKLETFSTEDLISAGKKRGVDLQMLCQVGAIDPRQENLCVLLFYADEIKKSAKPSGSEESTGSEEKLDSGPAKKKAKTSTPDVQQLQEKVDGLSKKFDEKKKSDELGELERVRREAKEEAAKGDWANVDVLNQKLVLMESMAAKLNHASKKEMTMILARFHANKACPGLAAQLVLKFLSTKEEEGVLEKEFKVKKQYAYGYPGGMPTRHMFNPYNPYDMYRPGFDMYRPGFDMYRPKSAVSPWARSPTPYQRMRHSAPRLPGVCYNCNKPGHLIKNCPLPLSN